MNYVDAGFNGFLDRSIGATPEAETLNQLDSQSMNSLALDQLQVSGSLGNTFQLSGAIKGGQMRDLTLTGDLSLAGKLSIGGNKMTFDGRTVQFITRDEDGVERILIGRIVGGF